MTTAEIRELSNYLEDNFLNNKQNKTQLIETLNQINAVMHNLTNDDTFNHIIKVRGCNTTNVLPEELARIYNKLNELENNDNAETLETELIKLEKELIEKESNLINNIKESKELNVKHDEIKEEINNITIKVYEDSIILLNNKIRYLANDELDTKSKKIKNTIKKYKERLINKAEIEKDKRALRGLNIAIKVLNGSNDVSFSKLKMLSFKDANKYSRLSNKNRKSINFKDDVVAISEAINLLILEQQKEQQKENKMNIYKEIKKQLDNK